MPMKPANVPVCSHPRHRRLQFFVIFRYNLTIVRDIQGAEELDTPQILENGASSEEKVDQEDDRVRNNTTTQVPAWLAHMCVDV